MRKMENVHKYENDIQNAFICHSLDEIACKKAPETRFHDKWVSKERFWGKSARDSGKLTRGKEKAKQDGLSPKKSLTAGNFSRTFREFLERKLASKLSQDEESWSFTHWFQDRSLRFLRYRRLGAKGTSR